MGLDRLFWRLSVIISEQLALHISNTQGHRMVVENLILDGTVQTMFVI